MASEARTADGLPLGEPPEPDIVVWDDPGTDESVMVLVGVSWHAKPGGKLLSIKRRQGHVPAALDAHQCRRVAEALVPDLVALVAAVREMFETTDREGQKGVRDNDCFEWPCGYAAVRAALATLDGEGATDGN